MGLGSKLKKAAKSTYSSVTNNTVKAALNIATGGVSSATNIAKTAVDAGKSILSGDTSGAYNTVKSGAKAGVNQFASSQTGGAVDARIFRGDKRAGDMGADDPALPATKTPSEIEAEEQDVATKQYRETILNRTRGRFNNSLLGGSAY